MAKQLNVNLAFKADTTQAKQQLQQLQTQLNNLTTSSISQQLPITPKLQEAQNAAINLKIALQQSMNVDTGKFDLTKFNNSLKRAGTSLNQMRVDLSKFGPEGQQAFMTLAQSIMQAEVPMRRTNALLTQLGITLKNTAKWQISSMALHGFMSAVSGAYGYAQDLNESLNNIRIVTGKNIEDMKNFANQANKAAKALSTTTTAYTDASLIYYQQGLSDAEVLKRADVTVKMANATGQAAEVVSDQMTAIWNNFYDGSKALEYYSDVVTALGAATASSSDEIAEGLEKFAAVADTVGLSYEYATSALATVTATTRQSADVVGTAFKTLFARIQDLELGKTLDDGTTLGAYAESLQAVGINIKESNGELKKMDDILNEMGSVWKTLGNDQQAALAQSVAGVRQYTQLMALMENWDYFKDNLEVAKDATGTLQEQADIYAESWEAAQKRVQASAQAIYQDLISDEFFIDLQNNFADFLDIIDKAIDGMGGLKGVIALLGGVLLTAFSGQAARGLENMAYNIKMMTAWGQQEIMQTKELAYQEAMRVSNSGQSPETQEAQVKVMQTQLLLQNDLVKRASNISEEEKQRCQAIINENKLYGEQLIELTKIKEQISDSKSQQVQSLRVQATQQKAAPLTKEQNQSFSEAQGIVQLGYNTQQTINSINQSFDPKRINDYRASIQDLITQITELKNSGANVQSLESSLKFLQGSLDTLATSGTTKQFQQLIHEMSMDGVASTNSIAGAMQHLHEILGLPEKDFQELAQLMLQLAEAENKAQNANNNFKTSVENSRLAIANAKAAMSTWADSLVRIAGGVSSLAFAMQSLSSIGDVFNNEDMTAGEKFLQITMSLSMAIPMLVNGLKALRLVKLKDLATTTLSTIVKVANAAATNAQAKAEARKAAATNASRKETDKQTVSETANTVAKKVNKTSPGGTGKTGFFGNIKNSWNQQALANNPNFTKMKNGAYQVKTTTGTGSTFMSADKAASMAGKQALSSLGSMLGTLGLVAAGIAVAAASITIASNVYNKDAKAAEEASKSAAKAAEMYQNTRAKYEELKSTVSGYQDQVKAISEMTKGTLEWKEAINAANEEALKLIDTYDILDYSVNKETGLIEFGEGAIEDAQAKEFGNMTRAQRASLSADVYASKAQMKADTTKFNREYANHIGMSDEDWAIVGGATGAGAGTGAAIGAIVGSIVPVIGNAFGAGVGAAIGAGVGLISGAIGAAIDNDSEEQEEDAINKLVEIYGAKGNGMFADSEFSAILDSIGASESLKESLLENKKETQKLIQELHANTESNRLKNQQQMQSYLDSGNNAVYDNSEYQTQIAGILANSKAFDKAKQEAEDKAWKGTDKRIHEAYAEYLGYTEEAGWKIKDTHSGTGKFTNKETGEEIELDDETMVEFLTNEYARQEAAKNVEEVSALLDSLTNVSGLNDDDMITAQNAIANFIAGDSDKLLALSDEQMDAVKEQLKNGISLTDEEAQMLGYNNAKAFTEAFDKQFENWSHMSKEQRAEKMAAIKQQEFDSAIASTAQNLGVSSEALEGYTKALQSANPELKDNSEDAIAAAKANINFSKGVAKLDEALKDNYDILHDWNEESFETYEAAGKVQAAVKEMFGVDVSANFIRDNLQELQELTEGNTEHLDELREAAAKDFVVNLGLEEGATNALDSALDALINQDREGIKIGAEVDLGSSVDQLNQFLKDGTLTAEQVTQAFNAIGYEPEIGYITDKGQETHTSNRIEWNGLPLGTVDSYTTSDVSIPYIKSSTNKDSKGNSNKSSATKTTSTGSIAANLAGSKTVQDKQDKKEDRLKSLKDELDRYHEINEIISDTERELDRLGKAKDRAFGANKLTLMDQEIEKQKDLIKNNEELLKQAQEYAAADKKDLIANTASNLSIQFDEYGRIANYEDLQAAYIKRLEQNVGNESLYEDIEEEYEAFKDAAEKYEESLNKVEEQAETLNDQLDELYSKNLEKIEYNVQIKVDIADDDKAYIDFLMQKIEDDAFAAADAIGLMGREVETIMSKIEANQQGIIDIQNAVANGEITPEQGAEKLREYRDELIDLNADLLEVRQTVQDKLTEAFEAWNEKIEEGTSKLEFYGSVLEGYKNIIDIIGKDMLGISDETMTNLNKAIVSNANDAIRATKAQLDANEATLKRMREARDEAKARDDEDSAKEWDEQIKIAEEKSQELTTTLQDNLSTGLQAAADAFGEIVNQIAENFSKAVSGIYDSIEEMREGWDRQQEVADRFLDTYEQTYELNKLNRQIQKNIDSTDNVNSQKELRKLQQEMLEMTKDGQQLSKYDLEYLQKKYDLMVAEQAFKDAQNAKSVVRLQRDSEGNFGYVYTADQNNVDNAQQGYEDKLFAFQQYTTKMDKELTEMYITVQEQAYERMQAAAEMYGEGTEAFEQERQKILQQYNIDMGYITDEYDKLTERNLRINKDFNAGVADTYKQTFINSIAPQYDDFAELYNGTTTRCQEACGQLSTAIENLRNTFSKQLNLAGGDIDSFEKTVNDKLKLVREDSQKTADEVEIMAWDMDEALNKPGGAIDAVESFQEGFSNYMKNVRAETDTTINKVNSLITEYNKLAEATGKDYTPETKPPETIKGNNSNKKSPDTTIIDEKTPNSEILQVKNKITGKYDPKGEEAYVQIDNGKWYSVFDIVNTDGKTAYALGTGDIVDIEKSKKNGFDVNKGFSQATMEKLKTANTYVGKTLEVIGSGKIKNALTSMDSIKYTDEIDNPSGVDPNVECIGAGISDLNGNIYLQIQDKGALFRKDFYNKNPIWLPINTLNYKNKAISLNTGGYTGDWGPEGRLAMLHQKEIVLNAHDTENFLTAIGIVRDISDQIEKNAIVMQYQNQLANYRASVGNSDKTLQQEVHITAEFPNATDHNEIEEAFRNLTNLASQYANRKS